MRVLYEHPWWTIAFINMAGFWLFWASAAFGPLTRKPE